MFCSYRISTGKLSRGPSAIAEFLVQDGIHRHLALSNSQNFIGWRCSEGPYASLYQISSKSVILLRRYCNFSNFQNGCRRHLGFRNREILLAIRVERVETHQTNQHAKFRQNRSISCKDKRYFFNMGPTPSWIFKFVKFYWLKVSGGPRRITVPNFV